MEEKLSGLSRCYNALKALFSKTDVRVLNDLSAPYTPLGMPIKAGLRMFTILLYDLDGDAFAVDVHVSSFRKLGRTEIPEMTVDSLPVGLAKNIWG